MKEIHKRMLSVLVSMLLLPYIITLFISGQDVATYSKNNTQEIVEVEVNDKKIKMTEAEYLIGILAKEIPVEYELEAMKSQAIIIRTRLYKESYGDETYSYKETYFTYEDIIKKWNGSDVSSIYGQLKNAVESTLGIVVSVDNELVITPYHSQNTGMTRNAEDGLGTSYSHLLPVECGLDVIGINASSKCIIKYEDIAKKLGIERELTFDDINIITTADDGYITELCIGEKVIMGEQFRELYQLNSTVISLQEVDENYFQITARGQGHGIGLSQNTANYMALEGKDYAEILKYFYTNIELKDIEEIKKITE